MKKIILGILFGTAFLLAAQPIQAAVGTFNLKFYDAAGNALTFSQVQSLQIGPKSGAYAADALIDPVTLRLITSTPMTDAGKLSFNLPASQAVAFAINWPTSTQGYGLVILDNGGNGFSSSVTVNFTYQAANDLLRRLNTALAGRAEYVHSAAFDAAYNTATNCLGVADLSASDSVKGAQGQLALDQLVVAYDLLLQEYGQCFARKNQATTPPRLGFTIEDVTNYKKDLDKLAAMAGPYAWVRIVFQPEDPISAYTATVSYAQSKGIKVMGEPVDSVADTGYTRAQYLQRFKDCIAAYPGIDAWEVGNEVNGGWSSADIADRVADVAAYCKSQGKQTYLTLFWQINTSDNTFALFNWISANLPASVRTNLDCVGLSQYQEQAPIGAAFDQVMRRMQVEFPTQQIGLAELGYWIAGQRYWWSGSTNVTTAKHMVLDQYYRASLGYARAQGGCFWWNFASAGSEYDFDATMTNCISNLKTFLMSPVPAPASVPLSLSHANGQIRISWPIAASGWVLETTTIPSGGTSVWTQVPSSLFQTNATEYFVADSQSVGCAFYRLRQP